MLSTIQDISNIGTHINRLDKLKHICKLSLQEEESQKQTIKDGLLIKT